MWIYFFLYFTMKLNRSFQTNLITIIDFEKVQKYSRIVDTYQHIYYNIQIFSNKNKNSNGKNTSIKFLWPSNESVWLPFHGLIYKFDRYIFREIATCSNTIIFLYEIHIHKGFSITHRDEISFMLISICNKAIYIYKYSTVIFKILKFEFEIIFHVINLFYIIRKNKS